jgi:hypothetical protein
LELARYSITKKSLECKIICGALTNLANDNALNKISIAAAGGFETILAAMRQHELVAGVQDLGCNAF